VDSYQVDGWHALGDPTRRAIFERLAERPRAVGELAGELPVSRPAVSQHLKVLKEAGLVVDRRAGNRRIYQLHPDGVGALRAQVDWFWNQALVTYKQVVEQPTEEGLMTTQIQEASVRTQVVVEAPIERAFRVFTEEFDRIKPREHNMLDVDIAETVFEPRVGGHIYDRGVDGRECRWARVLAHEPPDRVVFSWDISPQFQIETDLERTSEVEVRFISETAERTRVELEHRNLHRHGEGWESERDAVGGEGGWPLYLQRYADQLKR
jgi:DNA-binding transcriptional ArsR family regulator